MYSSNYNSPLAMDLGKPITREIALEFYKPYI